MVKRILQVPQESSTNSSRGRQEAMRGDLRDPERIRNRGQELQNHSFPKGLASRTHRREYGSQQVGLQGYNRLHKTTCVPED